MRHCITAVGYDVGEVTALVFTGAIPFKDGTFSWFTDIFFHQLVLSCKKSKTECLVHDFLLNKMMN